MTGVSAVRQLTSEPAKFDAATASIHQPERSVSVLFNVLAIYLLSNIQIICRTHLHQAVSAVPVKNRSVIRPLFFTHGPMQSFSVERESFPTPRNGMDRINDDDNGVIRELQEMMLWPPLKNLQITLNSLSPPPQLEERNDVFASWWRKLQDSNWTKGHEDTHAYVAVDAVQRTVKAKTLS